MFKNFAPVIFLNLVLVSAISCRQYTSEAVTKPNLDTLISSGNNPYVTADQSPMDMIYLPADFPVKKMQLHTDESIVPVARISYSRPHKKGRKIFGTDSTSLCSYGKLWRLGANEATEIILYRAVNIGGNNIGSGSYTMFCIPQADSWEIIFNSETNIWGLNRNASRDLFKVSIPVMMQQPSLEDFTMLFTETKSGGALLMAWDNVKATLPVTYLR